MIDNIIKQMLQSYVMKQYLKYNLYYNEFWWNFKNCFFFLNINGYIKKVFANIKKIIKLIWKIK
jgi:hypothetical protein